MFSRRSDASRSHYRARFVLLAGAGTLLLLVLGALPSHTTAQNGTTPSGQVPTEPSATPPPEPGALRPGAVYELPSVFVTSVSVDEFSPTRGIVGRYVVENREKTVQGDLRAQFQLLGPAPEVAPGSVQADQASEYDRVVLEEAVSLLPQQKKTLTFQYRPPVVPLGDYRLRIRLITSAGRALGWSDTPVQIGTPEASFVFLEQGPIVLPEGKTEYADVGPNVPPGAALTLHAQAINRGSKGITAQSHITVYSGQITGTVVGEHQGETLSLAAGETRDVALIVTAPQAPGAYLAVVVLKDAAGNKVSSWTSYRYVVRGPSARVVAARFEQLALARGGEVVIGLDVVGSADGNTPATVNAAVTLLDGGNIVGEQALPSLDLRAGVRAAKVHFTLPADIQSPSFRVVLRDASGKVLDTYEPRGALSPAEIQQLAAAPPGGPTSKLPVSPLFIVGMVSAGAALLLVVLRPILRGRRPPPGGVALVILLAVAAGALSRSRTTEAGQGGYGFWVYSSATPFPIMSLFVNAPVHDGYYVSNVPVDFTVDFISCFNAVTNVRGVVQHNASGGKVSSWLPNPVTDFDILWERPAFSDCRNTHDCNIAQNFAGVVNVGFPAPWIATTFQFDAALSTKRDDTEFRGREVRGVWVNFNVPPRGSQESTSCTEVRGWACDLNSPTRATTVEIQADDTVIGTTPAQLPRDLTRLLGTRLYVIGGTTPAPSPSSPSGPGDVSIVCGGTTNHEFRFPLPSNLRDGLTHVISTYAFDDKAGGIDLGKVLIGSKQISCPALQPDLSVDSVRPGSISVAGSPLSLHATVRNVRPGATAPVEIPTTVRFYIDGSPVGESETSAPFAIDYAQPFTLSWVSTAGTHRLQVCADADDEVTESNEDNNCGVSAAFTVRAAGATPTPSADVPLGGVEEQQP